MIITITGKPCSGKGTVAKEFCKQFNFEYICTGDMFRAFAKEFGYSNILDFQQQDSRIKQIDKLVDDKIYEIGKTRSDENIVIDSRLAWHFIPNSFKVFIDVQDNVAGERLMNANRDTEEYKTLDDAIEGLQSRWNLENTRYMELYQTNNLNPANYDFIIDSSNLTPNEIVEQIHLAYENHLKQNWILINNKSNARHCFFNTFRTFHIAWTMNKWLKITLIILLFATISAVTFLILKVCNIADIQTLKNIIAKSGKYGFIVYTILLVLVLVAFCFIPLLNTAMAVLGIAIFGSKVAFITNIIAVFFSTTILFFIGDKLGEKFASKLIGKKNLEETQNLIDHKSKFWLPILFVTPGIPDEAICLVAGMTKMKYWYVTIVSVVYHVVEIGLFCFIGSGLINWSALSIFEWVLLANLVIVDVYLLTKFEKFLSNKTKQKNN